MVALTRGLLFHSNREVKFPRLEKLGFHLSTDEYDTPWNQACRDEKDVYEEKQMLVLREKTALLKAACEEAGIEYRIVRERLAGTGRWGEGVYEMIM
jgi:hypothetical protein